MEKYRNEDYLKKEIMQQSRHLFVYGYNTDYRSQFLQSMEKDYPVQADSDRPVALYFDTFGMPKIDFNQGDKNQYLIEAMSREYLHFTIASKILERTMELDKTILDSRLSRLIYLTNISKNNGYPEIETIEDLLREVKTSRNYYYQSYIYYVKGLIENVSIDDISVPFMQLEMFVSQYKEAMNIDSYLGIILDKKRPLAISSVQAINNLIGGRINKDISIKVVTEPDDWETYRDVNGQFIEATHDYGNVELDDSYKAYMKILKR
ncbi:MAG: hypothetical protein Q4E75_03850 [bacterium]|nr:hypothetical protein [bacterium]